MVHVHTGMSAQNSWLRTFARPDQYGIFPPGRLSLADRGIAAGRRCSRPKPELTLWIASGAGWVNC
jgi:hypothetical protein